MGVDRMIFLIAIIRVVENHVAPNANGGLTCDRSKWKYLFVLDPAANDINLLTDLVESARSAIVTRSTVEGDPVQVIVSPEDFTEFQKKSQALKVYKSHSLQCVNQKTNKKVTNFETNRSRSSSEFSETAKENSSARNTTRLALKSSKYFKGTNCKNSGDCKTEYRKKLIPLKDVEKSFTTILFDYPTSRVSRASKTNGKDPKNRTSKQKPKDKSANKPRKGKTNSKPKDQEKSSKNNDEGRRNNARKNTNTNKENKKTTLIPESWSKLMSLAAKSLTKSNDSSKKSNSGKEISRSITPEKTMSLVKVGNTRKAITTKKNSLKQVEKPESKSTRKSAVKTKSSSTRNQETEYKKFASKPQGGRKSSSRLSPPIRKKSKSKSNRDSRELKISAEQGTISSVDNLRKNKRSVRHVKRDFTFHTPMVCAVIKISNYCDDDCSENEESSSETKAEDNNANNTSDGVLKNVPVLAQDKSLSDSWFQSEIAPDQLDLQYQSEIESNEPFVNPYNKFPSLPMEARDQYAENVDDSDSVEPENYAEMDEYEDPPQNYDDELYPQMPKRPFHNSFRPGGFPYSPTDYQDLPDPSSDVYSAAVPSVPKHGDVPEYPMLPENRIPDQNEKFWHKPSASKLPSVSPTSALQPEEKLKTPVSPESILRMPLGSLNPWSKFLESSGDLFDVPGDFEENIEDNDEDEEEYNEEDKEKNELEMSAIPAPVKLQIKPEEIFGDFTIKENKMDEEESSSGYDGNHDDDDDDDDYEDMNEDNENYDDNQEDYVEENGNAGIDEEDDYDLDED